MIHFLGLLILAGGVGAAKKIKLKPAAFSCTTLAEPSEGLVETGQKSNIFPLVPLETSNPVDEAKNSLIRSSGILGLSIVGSSLLPALLPISVFLTGYFAADLFRDAYTAIFKEKKIRVDILDATVVSLCILFGQVAVAVFMVWVLDIVSLLLEKSRRRSQLYIANIFGEQSRYAWLLMDGQEIEVAVKELRKGDIIVVTTGEQVPVDGIVVHGEAMIDQHSLTGESAPVEKKEKDHVFATTVLLSGKIHIEVQETGEHTLASKIIHIIQDASEYKVELQSVGENLAEKMVIPTLTLGAIGMATSGASASMAIINADFGTGIRVAAPIALLTSLGVAAKNGVLIKDSKVFEILKDIDVVLFDKTGTLTHDVPTIHRIVSSGPEYFEDLILFKAAIAEQKFSHPIAKAILGEASTRGFVLPPHDDSKYVVGFGIEVMGNDSLVMVGSTNYMEREGIEIPSHIQQSLQESRDQGNTAIFVAINRQVAGMIDLKTTVRRETADIISHIRNRGVKEIVLISGDHEAPTSQLAHQLGVDRYFARVLPHEKANYVKLLQSEGKKVMMVGDGINDSAALSYADISVSLQGASTIAMDVADVVFMDGNLEKFDFLFGVSDALQRNVKRSFIMIAIPNSICITGALIGFLGLPASLLLNNGFNIIAVMNGAIPYRIEGRDHQHKVA